MKKVIRRENSNKVSVFAYGTVAGMGALVLSLFLSSDRTTLSMSFFAGFYFFIMFDTLLGQFKEFRILKGMVKRESARQKV